MTTKQATVVDLEMSPFERLAGRGRIAAHRKSAFRRGWEGVEPILGDIEALDQARIAAIGAKWKTELGLA